MVLRTGWSLVQPKLYIMRYSPAVSASSLRWVVFDWVSSPSMNCRYLDELGSAYFVVRPCFWLTILATITFAGAYL